MISAWKKQVDEVESLRRRYHRLDREEHSRRHQLRHHVELHWLRAETLLWTAVTGWIWFSRRRDQSEDDRGGLLAELIASFWIMQRWRRLTDRATDVVRNAEKTTTPEQGNNKPEEN